MIHHTFTSNPTLVKLYTSPEIQTTLLLMLALDKKIYLISNISCGKDWLTNLMFSLVWTSGNSFCSEILQNFNNILTTSHNNRSSASNKLIHPHHVNKVSHHSYFHRLPALWNTMPIIDLNWLFTVIKTRLKSYLWNHFLYNFNDNINCSFHFLCPCSRCHQSKPTTPITNLYHHNING